MSKGDRTAGGEPDADSRELHLGGQAAGRALGGGYDPVRSSITPATEEADVDDWRDRMAEDPAVCHGRVCIRGTRIVVSVVLDSLAASVSAADILRNHPTLRQEDLDAAIAYAAEIAREQLIPLAPAKA